MKKKLLAAFLAATLVLGLMPATALAKKPEDKGKPAIELPSAAKAEKEAVEPRANKPKTPKVKEAPVKPSAPATKKSTESPPKKGKDVEPTVKTPKVPAKPVTPKRSVESAETVAITLELHAPHRGSDSRTFQCEGPYSSNPSAVTWHFVLNGLRGESGKGRIDATFEKAGTITVYAGKINKQMQHFYVTTPGHDVLVTAYASVITSEDARAKLVLSHVAMTGPTPPPSDEPTCPPPPSEEPTCPPPPSTEPTPPAPPKPPVSPEPKPSVEPKPAINVREAPKEELPYTGGDLGLLVLATIGAVATGVTLRKYGLH